MLTPEGREKKKIDDFLKSIDAYVIKPFQAGYGANGVPDRIALWNGLFIGIEVKREGKEPTALQWRRIEEIKARGGHAFWGVASKVIPELTELINTSCLQTANELLKR